MHIPEHPCAAWRIDEPTRELIDGRGLGIVLWEAGSSAEVGDGNKRRPTFMAAE